jgi:hypothetical protein
MSSCDFDLYSEGVDSSTSIGETNQEIVPKVFGGPSDGNRTKILKKELGH